MDRNIVRFFTLRLLPHISPFEMLDLISPVKISGIKILYNLDVQLLSFALSGPDIANTPRLSTYLEKGLFFSILAKSFGSYTLCH